MKPLSSNFRVAALVAACSVLPDVAIAACDGTGFPSRQIDLRSAAPVNVGRDVAVGQVISTLMFQITPAAAQFGRCVDNGNSFVRGSMPLIPGSTEIYASGVPGIGLRFRMFVSSGLYPGNILVPSGQYLQGLQYLRPNGGLFWNPPDHVQLELIKTASVTGTGAIAAGTYITMGLDQGPTRFTASIPANGIRISTVSCQTPNVTVNLGNHTTSELNAVDKFTSSTDFDIPLNSCPSGIRTIRYQVDAVTRVLDADRAIAALNSSSTAQGGIGVQLLDRSNNAHKFATSNTLAGATAAGGNFRIPLRARYYRTGPVISSGTASTSMTFTIFYE